jgi:hypothetical protein
MKRTWLLTDIANSGDNEEEAEYILRHKYLEEKEHVERIKQK